MSPLALAFNTAVVRAGLQPWVECESPTLDAAAANRAWGAGI